MTSKSTGCGHRVEQSVDQCGDVGLQRLDHLRRERLAAPACAAGCGRAGRGTGNPASPNGRGVVAVGDLALRDGRFSRSLADDGCRSTSSQSCERREHRQVGFRHAAAVRARGSARYTGYGSARFAGSSSCSSSCLRLRGGRHALIVHASEAAGQVVPAQDVLAQLVELAGEDRCADLVDEPDDEPLVVDRAQRRRTASPWP